MTGSAGRWIARADRIWNDGICKVIATSRPGSPGMVDPDSGRFLQARRLSKLRGLWTDDPDFLIDQFDYVSTSHMLALSVPFGLLPAVRSALTPDRREHPPCQ